MRADILPPRSDDRLYLTEGGIETEIMYKDGFELPHFAMFPLLDDPAALEAMKQMWRRMLGVAAETGFCVVLNGLDYRASPDWGRLLGYSPEGLATIQHRCIDFLRDLAREFENSIEKIYISGTVGPRGDAYSLNRTITADEAEEYHSVQLETLREAGVDLAWAMTFNNVPESVGATRAANALGVSFAMGLTLDSSCKLKSGPTLAQAIVEIDQQTSFGPEFYACNCSHPLEFEPALDGGAWQERLRCIRPNASAMEKIALCKLGHLEDGDPAELGQQMADVAQRLPHMDIFGGCCGTDERHLREIAYRVRNIRRKMVREQE
ncbi:homocysteine S-methyltransferase family protein [Frigidibacter sp. ROC022]|uniref:homocysteine S-methyltransferase family protein n=1 Tax=Frigidibacter sp. ROC022 TaxID=2971796 RepID=UPI00215A18CD|nr:homocysteine S-methyltransferase family protein [Frigidibacter sp. ROC022]MCR8725891.1 homocysteine S-methyltransferase family protein [Frigidibacter sp. ROC022]